MLTSNRLKWAFRLDSFCIVVGAMVPVGIIIGNAGFESMVALAGICWIIRSIIAKENPWPGLLKHPLILPWLFWYGSIIISLAWNGPGSKGWAHDIVFIRYFLYFSALLDISKRRSIITPLLIGLAAGVLWSLFNIILAYAIGHDVFGKPLIRYTSKLKEAGRVASLAAYIGPFFLAWSFLDFRLTYKMRIATALVGIMAMIQIFHVPIRTVQIASIAGILSFMTYFIFTKITRIWTFFIILLMGLFIGIFIKFGPQWDFKSFYDRISIWKVAWVMWLDHPITGVSVSAWQDSYKEIVASGSVSPYVASDGFMVRSPEAAHAHSLFLQLLACTGILGFCSFCWLFINIIRMAFQKNVSGWRIGLITWPIVFIVIGLTGWNIFGSQYQTVFAYFMILTAVSVNQQEI
ncbi:MAG: O-antigen ligase family protein [Desulfobacula sp.]|uniref:O-antigen ligase family protein n=1 Tax=Desulfobacula sp. TaxID=2593537 RepID=UPI0025C0A4A3|nr:O-antigen ligase family protein [Desulfobacula sp.]MCD4721462.1 O-antigen ligase family protein [Desulfobacula sp.]